MIGALINHLWQSTLFAGIAWTLSAAFRKNRAQVRYWLWFGASLKFLVPFSLLMSLGSHWGWVSAKKIAMAAPVVSFTIEQIAQPVPTFSPSVPATRSVAAAGNSFVILSFLAVWIFGFSALVLLRLRVWRRVQAVVRTSTLLEALSANIPVEVQVRCSPGLMEPGVVGWLRPILLLPSGIAERLTPSQFEAVLAHELCHIRRRDNFTSGIHMIVEGVFWFNPIVWWIGSRLLEERERSCDEEVLRLGSKPQVYAEGILNVCKSYLESPMHCVSGVAGSDLKKRIHAILSRHVVSDLSFAKKVVLAVTGMVVLAAPLSVGMMRASVLWAQSPFVSWEAISGSGSPVPATLVQSGAASVPQFEIASIKSNPFAPFPGRMGAQINTSPGLLSTPGATLKELIGAAYGLESYQISGGPEWSNSARFAVDAKPMSAADRAQLLHMLQPLLADQFKLAFHSETRELLVYALVVAKSGPKFQKLKPGMESTPGKLNHLGRNVDLAWFARYLTHFGSDRPVLDKTGLIGNFDLDLDMTRIIPAAAIAEGGTPGIGSVFQATADAIENQLGLKLVPTKAPIQVVVIDHAERPSGN